jgi:CHAD domain-containing protein
MAFELNRDEPVDAGLERLAKKTLSKGLAALAKAPTADAVHEARKSVKKIRAIVSLVERSAGHTRPIRKSLRRASRRLSPLRDARAIADTCTRLVDESPNNLRPVLRAIARSLAARARRLERKAFERDLRGDTRRTLRRTRRALRQARLDRVGEQAVGDGVQRAYRRARRALRDAQASGGPEDFHRWRKRVKTLWYHARLLVTHWRTHDAVDTLGKIEEWLGEDHNVGVLRERLASKRRWRVPSVVSAIGHTCDRYQAELRRQAMAAGEGFFADQAGAFVRRVRAAPRRQPRREAHAA